MSQIDIANNNHFILKPAFFEQQIEMYRAMQMAWNDNGWCVYIDELYYLEKQLKLQDTVIQLLTQGRSLGISVVLGIQRPAWVTRFALSEPLHILCARLGDKRDLATINSIVGSEYADIVERLPMFKFAWMNKLSGDVRIVDKNTVTKALTEG